MANGAVVFLSYLFMPVAVCSLYSESCNCVVLPVTRAGRSDSDHSVYLQVLLHQIYSLLQCSLPGGFIEDLPVI